MQSTGTGEDGHGLGYRWDVWLSSCLSHPSPPVSPTTVGYLTTPPTALASTPTTMLSQPGALVRMQGVPYTAGMKDLLSVFQAYQLAPDDYTALMPVADPPRTVLQAPKEWVCL